MTETITRERAAGLLNEVCAAEPDRSDAHGKYFEENGDNGCLCVVGAVLEKLGKGLSDLREVERDAGFGYTNTELNSVIFESVDVDGLEFTDDARQLLDAARGLNDTGERWGRIPAALGIVGVGPGNNVPEQEVIS